MDLNRQDGWEHLLAQYIISERADLSYEFGRNDCFKFCVNAIKIQTGTDILKGISYKTPADVKKLLKSGNKAHKAPKTLDGFIKAVLGSHKEPLRAQRGDIVKLPKSYVGINIHGATTDVTERHTWGSFGFLSLDGKNALVKTDDHGVLYVSLDQCVRAWSVDSV